MARPLRTIGAAAALLLALSGSASDAQQGQSAPQPEKTEPPPSTPQQPVFRAGINYVRVDVIVTDKSGNPVADLNAGDFEVTEDKKPQTVDTFKLVRLDGGATPGPDGPPRVIRSDTDEEMEAARDDVRLFAVFLDDYHVRHLQSMSVRDPLSSFIGTLGPSDMIGVMYPLESISSVRMTRNHAAVIKGIQQFVGRKGDYTPRNQFEEQYSRYPAETVERIRNEVSLSAIKGLIIHMGSLKEGRKALILVSEGYTNMLPPQLRDQNAQFPGSGNPQRGNPTAGNDPLEQQAAFMADVDMQTELREVFDTANRNNVAIYSVDPRGLSVSDFDIEQNINQRVGQQYLNTTLDTLRVLSENTDGRAIVNRNDLALGMKQIVRDSSAYYLIGYNSSQAPSDGKFHEIKVRVKRPGLQVRARKGYWALTAEETTRALAPKIGPPKAVEEALAAATQPLRNRVVRTWIGTSRGENGKTKVTFVWEPLAPPPGERASARTDVASRVSLTAVGPDGAPYFRGKVPDVALASIAPQAGGAAGTSPAARAPSLVAFDAAPGKMQLRVSIEGIDSQIIDTETRDIAVPDLTSSRAVLGTPQLLRARTVRELQQLKADRDAVPTPAREFSRTDRLLVRVPAYGPGNTTPTLRVHLLNRAGQPMTELRWDAGAAPSIQQIELPLAGLAPGEYLIEIKTAGDDGEVKELVGFRVTG